ncbi:RHS repeat domain-containing protein [Vibrio harveyi]|uniref:RHS repeat domain-containing protein n=1 Tax=Vibrio harveyi TaxID=669 RepID=UPI0018F23840|nr:RHS repeat-associated core domain-containing protein [Vibrio harveyi]
MMLYKIRKLLFLFLLLFTLIPKLVSAAQVYVISDFRNDVILEVDTKGKVLKRNYYQPFGIVESSGSVSSSEETGFAGQRYNREVELVYMGARHYDPVLRRFLEPDKYEFDEGVFNVNKYNYADNNPYKYGDPSGNVIETFFDVAMLAYDIYHGNWVDAGYDVIAIVVPGLPAGLNKIDDVAEATIRLRQTSNADTALDVTNKVEKLPIYDARTLKRMGEDAFHNFPASFEKSILSQNPILRSNGRSEFLQQGTINGKEGVFHITTDKGGKVMRHRAFIPKSDWARYSKRWELPEIDEVAK